MRAFEGLQVHDPVLGVGDDFGTTLDAMDKLRAPPIGGDGVI